MKMSRRARRMERHHARTTRGGKLNLIALVDIFTILVFFLVVGASEVEILPNTKVVKLPESIVEKQPKQTILIMVSGTDIIMQGRKIASVKDVLDAPEDVIAPLKNELEHQAGRQGSKANSDITIMGDRQIPYKLLKKIMVTCTQANYSNIFLAVLQKPRAAGQ
ncbi:MAG: biopolymer transporter ExbD [Gammaproteobacteria bacterium]